MEKNGKILKIEKVQGKSMKKIIIPVMPFVIMPLTIPVYRILDQLIFVKVFGCGCVPSTQTNMLNIPFNANDLHMVVFFGMAFVISIWSIFIVERFKNRVFRIIYCILVIGLNVGLAQWVINSFMWA